MSFINIFIIKLSKNKIRLYGVLFLCQLCIDAYKISNISQLVYFLEQKFVKVSLNINMHNLKRDLNGIKREITTLIIGAQNTFITIHQKLY